MKGPIRYCALFVLFVIQAHADFDSGLKAYKAGDHATAYREFLPLASTGNARAQNYIGQILLGEKKYEAAATWLIKAAYNGDADAQWWLGSMYAKGEGKDTAEKLRWWRRAAEQGNVYAQMGLAACYDLGDGVPQDFVQAYMWENLVAALANDQNVASTARDLRDGLAARMTNEQIAEAQKLARGWVPRLDGGAMDHGSQESEVPPRIEGEGRIAVTGTGFIVGRDGYLVTNHHVVAGCKVITGELDKQRYELRVIALDPGNDLALLQVAGTGETLPAATFRGVKPVRAGESAVAVGYPLMGMLSSNGAVTVGNVSALAGIDDDTRFLQITAPVQPGNSGGPLLDDGGNVIGIVVGKLNALEIAKSTGDIPQNVNFAIKAEIVRTFLDANIVHYAVADAVQPARKLDAAEIGDRSRGFTLLVVCSK